MFHTLVLQHFIPDIMKPMMHIPYAIMLIALLVTAKFGFTQTQPDPKTVTILSNGSKTTTPMVIKDEEGKVLTHQQMFALTSTGDYKLLEVKGKDNKPYYLVKKAPGFAPKPVAAPVVIKPGNR